MKKVLLFLFLGMMLFGIGPLNGQKKSYTVMFYNVENLFDTINDPNVYDEEFTPEGGKKWNSTKYWKKMANLEKVFYSISAEQKAYPTIIGVSEVENRNVLEDIVSLEKLQRAGYQIVHYDSPEARGVDVAFLYRPDQFICEGSFPVKTVIPSLPNFRTRDILTMWGTIQNEPFFFMVAHWPSRSGGQYVSEFKRCAVGEQMRQIADSVHKANPMTKIILMGDLNDDPTDKSIVECLGAKGNIKALESGDLYNPYYNIKKAGFGSLAYNDSWNLFDNIIVSENLATGSDGTLKLQKAPKSKFYGTIFNRPFLIQTTGQYKGYPLRTYSGNNFQNGFSDHLPVFITIGQ